MVVHIRKPLRKTKGNNFYKDKSNRDQGTLCGNPETSYDLAFKDKTFTKWNDLELCSECKFLKENNQFNDKKVKVKK